MTQARLASSIPLPMEHKLLVTVIEKAKDWALMHGVGMRDKKNFTKDSIQIAPFVLIPSPFPHTEFTKSVELQPVLNELMHKVAHDDEFLTRTLENALQVDEFTANLFDIWVKVRDEGMVGEYLTYFLVSAILFTVETRLTGQIVVVRDSDNRKSG
ncbi:glutathione synthetase-like [Maniola hyperantus]|uniref:glutathione synthetase-like n=1 Tax=Aphantopus hyperantus TaxID=2795564 RepID=UPI0037478A9D